MGNSMTDAASPENPDVVMDRRRLLKFGLGAAVAASVLLPEDVFALPSAPPRKVALYNMHTGESLRVEYWAKGRYTKDAIRAIERLMRDHRTGDVHSIDRRLIDVIYQLNRMLGGKQPVHVISGYRSPETNEYLRENSDGVAQNSYHMRGQAVDLQIPGRPLAQLRRAALKLRAGGVGYYPSSGFVHVDTGPIRRW
jgi:uncharacterized protein YcbK (DUF882 family)